MNHQWTQFLSVALLCSCAAFLGCPQTPNERDSGSGGGSGSTNTDSHTDEGHDDDDHGHDEGEGDDHAHNHAHGPNGEPSMTFEKLDLHVEVVPNSTTKTVKFVLHDNADHDPQLVPAKLDSVRIVMGEEAFELTAVDPTDGASAEYISEESADLMSALKVRPNAEITMGDKTDTVKMPAPH